MGRLVTSSGYSAISLEVMRLESIPGFDLYLMGPRGPILYRSRALPFTDKILTSLLENDVKYLYFRSGDEAQFYQYIEQNLDHIINDENVLPREKATLVYDAATNLAKQLFFDPTSSDTIRRASAVLDSIITFASHNKDSYKHIIEILPEDYYTHTHCVNVATYSLALGRSMGLNPNNGLFELTIGALLHDIGKSKVPESILNKNGPLSDPEYEIIKHHVVFGLQIMRESPSVPFGAYPAVIQHHERLSGEGYPRGLRDIHLFGRIVAVADVFDAVTTNRPYKKAITSYDALAMIKSESHKFDPEIVASMINIMGPKLENKPKLITV